jgi:hypothetical protein
MPDPHYRLVPVGRKEYGLFAVVDEADYDVVYRHHWSLSPSPSGNLYAVTHVFRRTVGMHRFIMGCNDRKLVIDHTDGVGLNNRRYNLREATRKQNSMNRFLGIRLCWRRWEAWLGKTIGRFGMLREAIVAYNEAASARYGNSAFLVDPDARDWKEVNAARAKISPRARDTAPVVRHDHSRFIDPLRNLTRKGRSATAPHRCTTPRQPRPDPIARSTPRVTNSRQANRSRPTDVQVAAWSHG